MKASPDEECDVVAESTTFDRGFPRSAVRNLTTSVTNGVPYWGEGQIHQEGLKRMIEAQKAVGAISGEVDYAKLYDTRFLPDDQKAMK